MAPDGSTNTVRAPSRWWRTGLLASLALNLLLIGLIAGSLLSAPIKGGRSPDVARLGLGPFERALEGPDRRALRGLLRAERAQLRQSGTALRRSVVQAIDILRTEPFEPAQLAAALASHRGAVAGLQEIGNDALVAYLAELDVPQRAAFADRLEAGLPRRGPRPEN